MRCFSDYLERAIPLPKITIASSRKGGFYVPYFLRLLAKLHPVTQGSVLLCLTVLVVVALLNPTIVGNLVSILKALPAIVYMPRIEGEPSEKER